MPLYDYRCRACSKVNEVRHGFREVYDGSCPDCGGELARVFNPAGIVFKGSGFYVNDSRKSNGSSEASASSSKPSTDAPSSGTSSTPAAASASAPAASSGADSSPKKSESSAA